MIDLFHKHVLNQIKFSEIFHTKFFSESFAEDFAEGFLCKGKKDLEQNYGTRNFWLRMHIHYVYDTIGLQDCWTSNYVKGRRKGESENKAGVIFSIKLLVKRPNCSKATISYIESAAVETDGQGSFQILKFSM